MKKRRTLLKKDLKILNILKDVPKFINFSVFSENKHYMSFGISPEKDRSVMIGADATTAYVDHETGKGYADDYQLTDKSQCSGGRGACPDGSLQNSVSNLVYAALTKT